MAEDARAYSRARAVRVAFLVQNDEHAGVVLSAIFAASMGRWGGRLSPVVPATADGPDPAYDAWLEAFDPDVIYSYVKLNDAAVARVHERFYPSYLSWHRLFGADRDERSFRPELRVPGLSSATLLPRAAAPQFDGARGVQVVDALGRRGADAAIRDSFGLFTGSIGRSFGRVYAEFGEALTLVADDEAQPREQHLGPNAKTVDSASSLLAAIGSRRVTTMSLLSAMSSPRLDFHSRRSDEFNLVVGDTFADRLFYWNARCLFPAWRDNEFVDLRLAEAAVDDASMVSALSDFLKRRNHVSYSGSNLPRVAIRSLSVGAEKLDRFSVALRAALGGWMTVGVSPVTSAADAIPTTAELTHARVSMPDHLFNPWVGQWQETRTTDLGVELVPPVPEHLRICPPSLNSPGSGCWAVDIDVEREANHSRYDNVRHRWRLPRRLRVTSAFLKGYDLPPNSIMMPRVERSGLITAYANTGPRFPKIALPGDEAAIKTGLLQGRDWWPFEEHGHGDQMPPQLVADVKRSSNGQHLWGVLGLVGGLRETQSLLLHEFWIDVFGRLGGSFSATDARRDAVVTNLAAVAGNHAPGSEEFLAATASLVLEEAERLRTMVPSIRWDELLSSFKKLRRKEWQENPGQHMTPAEAKEWREHEERSFRSRVQDLCERGVLHQGYEHRCRKCLHRSWISIGALTGTIRCDVCGEETPAPVDRHWDFRLNEFLREAIRKHGVVALIWCLSKQRSMRETSFFFEGPLDVYPDLSRWDGGAASTDLDLLCVGDGEVSMSEVKQSGRYLDPKQVSNFAALMKRLRPDVAQLAVMEPANDAIKAAFKPLEEQLAGTGIRTKLVTLCEGDIERALHAL